MRLVIDRGAESESLPSRTLGTLVGIVLWDVVCILEFARGAGVGGLCAWLGVVGITHLLLHGISRTWFLLLLECADPRHSCLTGRGCRCKLLPSGGEASSQSWALFTLS